MQVAIDIEPIMQEFERRLKTMPSFRTVTRRWQPWDQLADIAQPALVIVEPKETVTDRRGQQSAVKNIVQLIIYEKVDYQDKEVAPITKLNNLIKEVRQALLPSGADISRNANTLGGLVSNCCIEGDILKDAGILDEQASAYIPVTILIP